MSKGERPSYEAWINSGYLAGAIDHARLGHDTEKVEYWLRKTADELGYDVVKRRDA